MSCVYFPSFLREAVIYTPRPPPTHTHMHQNFPLSPPESLPNLFFTPTEQTGTSRLPLSCNCASWTSCTLVRSADGSGGGVRSVTCPAGRQAADARPFRQTQSRRTTENNRGLLSSHYVCVIKGLFLEIILSSGRLRAYIPLRLGETKLGGRGGGVKVRAGYVS